MKLRLIIIAIFTIQICFSQNSKVKPKNIENWINQNFSNARPAYNNGHYMFLAFTTIKDGIIYQKTTTKHFDSKLSALNEKSIMKLNLKNLYYDSVTYELTDGQYFIYAKCINNIICSESINEEGERNGSDNPLLGMIAENKADINKCVEAFGKLIKYYGGKKQYDW
ncbi:hypothetical protein KRX57_06645 [Weeksellaceae bacterium TAE3-ERU29]|nr:hypothetical protein [Weeksellaceae bacterium TAE3-ERU29]